MTANRSLDFREQAGDLSNDENPRAALLRSGGPSGARLPDSAEHDVWDWLKRVSAEFEVVRATNKKLRARINEMERLRGGVERLSEDEFVAELPNRMIRALQSAQHVGQEFVQRAQSQAGLILERAKAEAAQIRQAADADADARLRSASETARNLVHKAQEQAKQQMEQASLERERYLADLEARCHALEDDIAGYGDDLLHAFTAVRKALQEPRLTATVPHPISDRSTKRFGQDLPTAGQRRNGNHVEQAASGVRRTDPRRSVVASRPSSSAGVTHSHCKILLIGQPSHLGFMVASRLLQDRLTEVGIEASVRSAQLAGERRHLPAALFQLLRSRDLARPHPEVLSADLLDGADLVIGMTRSDVASALRVAHHAWPRAFTLKELVRRCRQSGDRRRGESVKACLRRLHAGREAATPSGPMDLPAYDDLDVETNSRSPQEMNRLVDEVGVLVKDLISLLWPVEIRRQVQERRHLFDDAGT